MLWHLLFIVHIAVVVSQSMNMLYMLYMHVNMGYNDI